VIAKTIVTQNVKPPKSMMTSSTKSELSKKEYAVTQAIMRIEDPNTTAQVITVQLYEKC
jgi:hypothetical protein